MRLTLTSSRELYKLITLGFFPFLIFFFYFAYFLKYTLTGKNPRAQQNLKICICEDTQNLQPAALLDAFAKTNQYNKE